jgi:hypothetical protein
MALYFNIFKTLSYFAQVTFLFFLNFVSLLKILFVCLLQYVECLNISFYVLLVKDIRTNVTRTNNRNSAGQIKYQNRIFVECLNISFYKSIGRNILMSVSTHAVLNILKYIAITMGKVSQSY